MFENTFRQILRETQVMALRHKANNEPEKLVQRIKSAIDENRFEIVSRDKNREFIKRYLKTNYRGAVGLIREYISPKDFVAVLENRDELGGELYLFTLKLNNRWTYLKVKFCDDDTVKAVSFHGQNERIYVDYRKSIDNPDDYRFCTAVGKDWMFRYNNRNPENRIINMISDTDGIELLFEKFQGKEVLGDLVASCPRDKGLNVMKLVVKPDSERNSLNIKIPEREQR